MLRSYVHTKSFISPGLWAGGKSCLVICYFYLFSRYLIATECHLCHLCILDMKTWKEEAGKSIVFIYMHHNNLEISCCYLPGHIWICLWKKGIHEIRNLFPKKGNFLLTWISCEIRGFSCYECSMEAKQKIWKEKYWQQKFWGFGILGFFDLLQNVIIDSQQESGVLSTQRTRPRFTTLMR